VRHTTKHHPYTAFEAEDESSYTPPKEPQAEVVRAVYWFVGAAVDHARVQLFIPPGAAAVPAARTIADHVHLREIRNPRRRSRANGPKGSRRDTQALGAKKSQEPPWHGQPRA
jgi:hypothetical protein